MAMVEAAEVADTRSKTALVFPTTPKIFFLFVFFLFSELQESRNHFFFLNSRGTSGHMFYIVCYISLSWEVCIGGWRVSLDSSTEPRQIHKKRWTSVGPTAQSTTTYLLPHPVNNHSPILILA